MKTGKTAIVGLPCHEFGSGNGMFFFFISVYLCSSVVARIFPAAQAFGFAIRIIQFPSYHRFAPEGIAAHAISVFVPVILVE